MGRRPIVQSPIKFRPRCTVVTQVPNGLAATARVVSIEYESGVESATSFPLLRMLGAI